MLLKYSLAWFPMMVIAIANGAIREFTYKPFVGELAAHQISTVTLLLFFSLYFWFLVERWKLESTRQALAVGALWVGMTLAFELGFGHYVMGNPWARLLYEYNVGEGRVWVLIPVWTFVAPYIFSLWSARKHTIGTHSTSAP